MDVREKLVEMVHNARMNALWHNAQKPDEYITDMLMEDGVTVQEDCKACAEATQNCIVKLQEQIAELRSVQEWISVKEHLPQENEPEGATCEQVQVLLSNGAVSTGWCNRHTKLWWHLNYGETHFIGYDYEHTPVIAWQPLAQPPKGE